ncbi:MAG: hypothetical protein JO360_15190 [Acidobacteria bacterium]|nr:hypothetical protein [Acidobacteriota bacterium]
MKIGSSLEALWERGCTWRTVGGELTAHVAVASTASAAGYGLEQKVLSFELIPTAFGNQTII